MCLEEKYDELDNILTTLDVLSNEIKDKYFLNMINELKIEAKSQLLEIKEYISKQEENELKEQNKKFEEGRL